ncbi:metallophosphoesterase [Clostridium malenominatum]|uniref:Metallophosphoesterase n=1 Tax=Clostridium malenominatum TaxID=1539 RepID=A0ABN1IZT9_9CLOT
MNYKILLIILAFLFIYFMANFYVGASIFKGVNTILTLSPKVFWPIFWIIAFSYIISMLLSRFMPSTINNILYLVGVYWMVALGYSLILFPIIHFLKWAFGANSTALNYIVISLVIIFFMFVGIYGTYNGSNSYVNAFNVSKNNKNVPSLNIAMISDIHLGNLIENKRLARMVEEINELNPDLVIIAGDIVDSDIKPFVDKNMALEFSKIKSKYGTYAALGNHDFMGGHGDVITEELKKAGVHVLRNEAFLVENSFYVIGRDDVSIKRFKGERPSLEDIVKDLDKSKFKIVIDHTPTSIIESEEMGIDLHFSGHTHRAQMWPFNFITGRLFEIDHGYLKKDNLQVVVSSGYGTWGPPIRIGSRSEIIIIDIK